VNYPKLQHRLRTRVLSIDGPVFLPLTHCALQFRMERKQTGGGNVHSSQSPTWPL